MGYDNENTVEDYGKNIAMSVGMNALGSLGGSYLFPKQNISGEFGRAAMNIGSQALPHIQNYMENRYGY